MSKILRDIEWPCRLSPGWILSPKTYASAQRVSRGAAAQAVGRRHRVLDYLGEPARSPPKVMASPDAPMPNTADASSELVMMTGAI